MFKITGEMLIGGESVRGTGSVLKAFNPSQESELQPDFGGGRDVDINTACVLAESVFDSFRSEPLEKRANFLEAIAENILALGDDLIVRAHQETALSIARLESERGRTVGQLRLFAAIVREGRFLDITIDSALPDRKPLPRPDLRLQRVPLGPVAVFGASNFPLAFSVAGGDTASAFAAGCPVIVKSHSGHLGTSELVGRAIQKAVKDVGLPNGVFSLVLGSGNIIGQSLVAHPAIKAVGFTGSRSGGIALMTTAAQRPEPIPVYAEMSSINPFYIFPRALEERTNAIAQGFVDSLTMGVGQFCTNPGLVILLDGPNTKQFIDSVSTYLESKPEQTMLTQGIASSYTNSVSRRLTEQDIEMLSEGCTSTEKNAALPVLFTTSYDHFMSNHEMQDEIFGPSSLIIVCKTTDELIHLSEHLKGQLTATLHLEDTDVDLAKNLLPILERKVGRILVNGYPTGVEVSYAMVHGGPFPATSDSRTTSVGAKAIERFLRPICYQNFPDSLLPISLKNENIFKYTRVLDGSITPPT